MVKKLLALSDCKEEPKATKQDDGDVSDVAMPMDTSKKVKRPSETAVEVISHMSGEASSLFQFEVAAKPVISAKYDRTRV